MAANDKGSFISIYLDNTISSSHDNGLGTFCFLDKLPRIDMGSWLKLYNEVIQYE
jgi:hypothetical protein